MLLTVGQGTCRGLGDTRTVLAIALGMNAFHLALDPIFIYGAGWGVSGAAAATVAAEVGAAAAYGVCMWRRSDVLGARAINANHCARSATMGTEINTARPLESLCWLSPPSRLLY